MAILTPPPTPITLLPIAARSTDTSAAVQDNSAGYTGLILLLTLTTTPGFGHGVFPVLQGFDDLSGTWYDLWGAPANYLATAGTYNFEAYPGAAQPATVPATFGAAVAVRLPKTWRATVQHADATSVSYGLAAVLLP